jgi:hypothetical protein
MFNQKNFNREKMVNHPDMPENTSGGADHGKSMPSAGVGQRSKNHGYGYPLTIDSIDHSKPEMATTDRGKGNKHGHSYPGRPYSKEGEAKNASPKPTKKSRNIVG